jgi:hypothetical protein
VGGDKAATTADDVVTPHAGSGPSPVTRRARAQHHGAVRVIWKNLLDRRDWVSYLYVPILVPILVLLPYFLARYYERSQRVSQIVESLAQGSRDVEQMARLLDGPVPPFTGVRAEELPPDAKADPKGFLVLQDLRLIDLRRWKGTGGRGDDSIVYGYRRLKVRREADNATNCTFRTSVVALSADTQVRFPQQQLTPKLYSRTQSSSAQGDRLVHWEIGIDFRKVPPGESADVIYEYTSPGLFLRDGVGSTTLAFEVEAETVELTRWLLLPQGREYRSFQVIRYPTGKPEASEPVRLVTEFLADDYTILAFKLLALKAGFTYEITWAYR